MANNNIFQRQITPVKPKVLEQERIYVYTPIADTSTQGIASYNDTDFKVNRGVVSLIWPEQMLVERLADPLTNISNIKLLSDEFEHTNTPATVTNPTTKTTYTSNTAEVKLNRKDRNAFEKPDLVMLDQNDFETTTQDDTDYVKYTLKKNDPLATPSLVQLDNQDFKRDAQGIVSINWPYAHNSGGTTKTNGYGLVKISSNKGLKFDDSGNLIFDSSIVNVHPTYGNPTFSGYSSYVDNRGIAVKDENGYPKVAITKDAVGLDKVENKAFGDYTWSNLSDNIKTEINNRIEQSGTTKVNDLETKWFGDWTPPTESKNTPQKWLTSLDDNAESIWESITSLKRFLGYYDNLDALKAAHPANRDVYGSTAFLLSSQTYWAVRATGVTYVLARDEELNPFINNNKSKFKVGDKIGIVETNQIFVWDGTQANLSGASLTYEWYNTNVSTTEFTDYMETDASKFKSNGMASAGTSGLWAQSDHIHPTDKTRLSVKDFNETAIHLVSDLSDEYPNFLITLDNTKPISYVNIPYVRKGQYLHNWNGQLAFNDTEASTEKYWRGTGDEFFEHLNEIDNNTICMVDDGETTVLGDFLTTSMLTNQGITIDQFDTNEQMVIIKRNEVDALYGRPITLAKSLDISTTEDRYVLRPIVLQDTGSQVVVGENGQLTSKRYTDNLLLTAENGNLASGVLHQESVLSTNRNGQSIKLEGAKLLMTDGNNVVTVKDFGVQADRLIITDGLGNIKPRRNTNSNVLLKTGSNNTVEETTINPEKLLLVPDTITNGAILLSNDTNSPNQFVTTKLNKLIVGNGTGGIQESTLASNKLLYTTDIGVIGTFSMTANDAGKLVGVNLSGAPTLIPSPIIPKTLPVTVYDQEPGVNQNGLVVCRLSVDPGIYSDGVLYMF